MHALTFYSIDWQTAPQTPDLAQKTQMKSTDIYSVSIASRAGLVLHPPNLSLAVALFFFFLSFFHGDLFICNVMYVLIFDY